MTLTATSMVGECDSSRKRKKPNRPDAAGMDFSLEPTLGHIFSSYEDELKKAGFAPEDDRDDGDIEEETRPPVMLFLRPLAPPLTPPSTASAPVAHPYASSSSRSSSEPITTDMFGN